MAENEQNQNLTDKAANLASEAKAAATEKLSEGIRLFCADIEKLEKLLLA